jgi:16S rRNA (cytidine1402-2'-O)-methyltransferase
MAPGRLSVCATPIGNLGDVTLRVLDTLRCADVIAAEDTRVTRTLLARYEIDTPLQSYHAHNIAARTPGLVDRITAGGHVALVSDAGTPGISDPGRAPRRCLHRSRPRRRGAARPLGHHHGARRERASHARVLLRGFPAEKSRRAGRASREARTLDATLVFYESPRRTAATVAALASVLPDREACMARELTKLHEEVVRAPVARLAELLADRELKGEVVLLVGPPVPGERPPLDHVAVSARLEELAQAGVSRSDAVRRVAAELGVPRNDVYRIAHGGT